MKRLRKIIGLLPLLASLALCPPAGASWFGTAPPPDAEAEANGRFATLSALADAVAAEFKANRAGMSLKLYLDREEVREDQTETSLPFAGMLADELTRALSGQGFTFEGTYVEHADYALSVSYHRTQDLVVIYPKFKRTKDGSYHNLKGNYGIVLDKLPEGAFEETIDGKLTRLAQRVGNRSGKARGLSILVAPIVESRCKYTSPFSDFVARKVKVALTDRCQMKIVEERPALKKKTTRGTGKETAGDPCLDGADAVIEGTYLRNNHEVNLSLTLKDLTGKVLSAAEESIPMSLVRYSLDNDEALTLAQIADTEHEQSGGLVRIGTIKGGNYQVFRDGEVVQFTVKVGRPLYIYVYNINPTGEVSLLYPQPGEAEDPKQSGLLYTIPELTDSWEIKVEAPYGKDAVKVFASDRRLPIPVISGRVAARVYRGGSRSLSRVNKGQKELSTQTSINGLDLVDYYLGIAAAKKAPLYESTVFVETRAQ